MQGLKHKAILLGAVLLLGIPPAFLLVRTEVEPPFPDASIGKAAGVRAAFAKWSAAHQARGGDRNVVLALGWSEGLSVEETGARGQARLDLIEGVVRVTVRDLADPEVEDVWLVDNQPHPGDSLAPERGDRMVRLGALTRTAEDARLVATVGPGFFDEFELDVVVVTRAGVRPEEGGVLYGFPSLFQRLHNQKRLAWHRSRQGDGVARLLTPAPAFAGVIFDPDPFDALIGKGAQLFFRETFRGNGRTCGTCHPAENNLTIDPLFIAGLPNNDPLFVAEFVPALANNFEKPKLMRQVGLILENTDGFGNLPTRFTMRSVPHTLALPTSLVPGPTCVGPDEATGWSCDGSPDDGSLRSFAKGAVTQHFPKTLNRVPGVDFRLPTDAELDAMAAFQLALGRSTDPVLANITFKGAIAARGKQVFVASACNGCHSNAGANVAGGINFNFNTGVEELLLPPGDIVDAANNPDDGGFNGGVCATGGIGNCEFNTPPLVEAADSGPFFHNNAVATIEGAVAFYNSDAFGNSPTGPALNFDASEVDAIAAFLRVLNAIENIRSAAEIAKNARQLNDLAQVQALLTVAIAETDDAIQVLAERGLETQAIFALEDARARIVQASQSPDFQVRADGLLKAIIVLLEARDSMASGTFWT